MSLAMHSVSLCTAGHSLSRLNGRSVLELFARFGYKGNMFRQLSSQILIVLIAAGFTSAGWCASLGGSINKIVARQSQKKVKYAIEIVNADSGKVVYSKNAHKAMIPASNMKLITSATAVKYLGANYEFSTKVGLKGRDLVIIGGGDPLLGDKSNDSDHERAAGWIFKDISAKLKKAGISSVNNIIADTSIFDDNRVHPSWPKAQLNRSYACEVSGLNYNGNCIRITATKSGSAVKLNVEPQSSFVKTINKVKAVSKGKSGIGAYRNTVPNKVTVSGKCRKSEGIDVAIERPAGLFLYILAEKLAMTGIDVKGELVEKPLINNARIKLLAEYKTPIADVLQRCNKNSFGLAAESLMKTIAALAKPGRNGGSWTDGQKIIPLYLVALGVGEDEFVIDDGSGLSRQNRLSPHTITSVLADAYESKNWTAFKESLAVGGRDGTIGKYFKESRYKGKVFGKTGYIKGVKSFSGYCIAPNGTVYIFSIITNNAYSGYTRTAINDIVKAVMDSGS